VTSGRRIAGLARRLFAFGLGCTPTPCHDTSVGLLEEYWSYRAAEYGTQDFPIYLPTATGYEKDGMYFGRRYAGAERGDRAGIEDWHRRRRGGILESFRVPSTSMPSCATGAFPGISSCLRSMRTNFDK
jgi:hypothetical protein